MSIFDRRADVVSGLYKAGLCSLSECLAASDAELAAMCLSCAPGYLQVPGDVGEKHLPAVTVTSCADCAKLCDGIAGCRAYSCGKTTRQCKLDSLTVPVMPSEASDKDVTVCSKEASLALPPQLPQPAGRRLLGECDCSRCTGVGLQGLQGTGSSDCADDPSWVDPVNGDAKCSSWVGYGCDDAWDGYSPASVVKAKCPRTCGLCTAEPSTTGEKDSLPASTPAPEPPEDVKAATLEKREVDTESTDRGSGSTHYLDRQDVDCKGNPISGFKMQTTDEMKKISYKLQCGTGANLDVSEDKQTSVEDDGGGGNLIFLDRLSVDCGSNAAISEFKLVRDGVDKHHYSYKCVSSELENPMIECENLSTQPNEGGRGGLIVEFLDRHDVQCPENKVLQRFKLTTADGGKEGGTIHYDYRCCAVKSDEQTPEAVVDKDGAEDAAKSAESAVDVDTTAETAKDAETVEATGSPASTDSSSAPVSATSPSAPPNAVTAAPSSPIAASPPTERASQVKRYVDIKSGQVFYGPAKGGQRVYKNPWENRYDDPFGFTADAKIQFAKTRKEWDHFDAFIKRQKAGGVLQANAKAEKMVRQLKQGLRRPWMGNLSPLIYRENHWFKGKKWEGDTHNGEEQAGREYHYRKPPLSKPSGLFPEPESVPIITGSVQDVMSGKER